MQPAFAALYSNLPEGGVSLTLAEREPNSDCPDADLSADFVDVVAGFRQFQRRDLTAPR
jgi:hypothetical protein